MASDLESTLRRISEKSRFLTERFRVVSEQLSQAHSHIAELENELKNRERRLEMLTTEVEYLRVSSILAPKAETVNATRSMLKELVREIDQCLADLKD